MKRALTMLAVTLGLVLGPAAAAHAHPLGNFTINQYSGLRVAADHIEIDHVVDLAEIPAFRELRAIGADEPDDVSAAEAAAYAARACRSAADAIALRTRGQLLPLAVTASSMSLPAGAAGLPTMRIECIISPVTTSATLGAVTFTNTAYGDRIGWREITVVGDGISISGDSLRATSVSARLTSYPDSLSGGALDERMVSFTVAPGNGGSVVSDADTGAASTSSTDAPPRGIDALSRSFTSLVAQQQLTLGTALIAALAAIALGALHAFAPGHGKTIMAAYLIGQRGSLRQATAIGLTVTATHTVGVLILGIILSLSSALAPEQLYSWLGVASGGLLLLIGAGLLRRAVRGDGHTHGAAHGHVHGPEGHTHDDVSPSGLPRTRSTIAVGFAGGLVPSPSALVVLLGAIALGRAWFGVVLVTFYGAGMALSLIAAGFLFVRARRVADARWSTRIARLGRLLPIGSAVVILAVGSILTSNAATKL